MNIPSGLLPPPLPGTNFNPLFHFDPTGNFTVQFGWIGRNSRDGLR